MSEENERFIVMSDGLSDYGVWDVDRMQWAITGYAEGDAGREAAIGAAARLNTRAAIRVATGL